MPDDTRIKQKERNEEKGLGTGATKVHTLDETTIKRLGEKQVHNFLAKLDTTLSKLHPDRPRTIFRRER